MPSYLPTNLFYLREQTRRVENLKSLSREKFVQLTNVHPVYIYTMGNGQISEEMVQEYDFFYSKGYT